jgi:hypothetical protein
MYTSIVLVAMLGPGGTSEAPASKSPSWLGSYSTARKMSRLEQKPLAVFIGAGRDGFGQVCKGQALPAEAREVLAANYVCVYLDTETPPGRKLATEFEMGAGPGLVLSSDGENQTFRHTGQLTRADLAQHLRQQAGLNGSANGANGGHVPVSYINGQPASPTTARPAARGGSTPAARTPVYGAPVYGGTPYAGGYGYGGNISSGSFGGFGGGRGGSC